MTTKTPESRIAAVNERPVRKEGDFVLYWMIANRRTAWNFSFDRAVEWSQQLGRPLVVLEALRCDYPWASERLHQFILDGMRDNRAALRDSAVIYYPYVEPALGAGKGLLRALSERACVVVTDDFPAFMLPRMVAAAGAQLDVRLEKIDSNGLLPMRLASREHSRAYVFRKFVHRNAAEHLATPPSAHPWGDLASESEQIPAKVLERWPAANDAVLAGETLKDLPIDHEVAVVDSAPGGRVAGLARLDQFIASLEEYETERNHPDAEATSRLSPYLHFGQLSSHEIVARLAEREGWSPERVDYDKAGKNAGFWGMGEAAEAYLDQVVTWREIGFNMCVERPDDYDDFETLPNWALRTLAEHEEDERQFLYSFEELDRGRTHDEVWNAAQNQLRAEGRIHNYMRMLWGKKILEWTENPRVALETMLALNDRYALDGRDPNSVSGIFWVLGRYDRAWGPERPVYGKVRYMSSQNARRKLHLTEYLAKWGS